MNLVLTADRYPRTYPVVVVVVGDLIGSRGRKRNTYIVG